MSRTFVVVAAFAVSACTHVDQVNAPGRPPAASQIAAGTPFANITLASPSPAGLRACFAAEANANDVVGGNVGVKIGAGGYVGGVFGQAFDFTTLGDGVSVPPHSSLNVGIADGLTISAWILARGTVFQNPTPENPFIYGSGPIVEYDRGAQLWAHNQQNTTDGLYTNLIEANGTWHQLQTPHGLDTLPQRWRHVAVTYSRLTGWQTHFVDGMPTYGVQSGLFVSRTTDSLRIGARAFEIVGGSAFTFNGAIDEVQIYDRALTAPELLQIASATGTMCVPPPASYRIAQVPIGSGESGVPFTTQPRVEILDAAGNVVINATNAVTVTASGSGTLTGTTTVNAVNGIATFTNLALQGTGTTSTTLTFTSGSLPVVGPATPPGALTTTQTARKLGITTQPGGAVTGALLAPQPVVQVQDAAGLAVPGAGNAVTATKASGAGTLSGTTTVIASNAVAAFGTLRVTGVGPHTLAFSSPGLTGVTSNPFDISLVPLSLRVVTQAAGGENGTPFTTQPVIEALDAGGNRDLSANVTVFVRVYSGTGEVLGTTSVHVVNGVAAFTDLRVTTPSGTGNIILEYGATAYVTVLSANLPIVQAVRQLVVTAGPTSIVSGLAMPTWTVELRDATGLKVASSTAAVHMGIASGLGTLSGTVDRNAVAGVATFINMIAVATAPLTFSFSLVTPPPTGAVLVNSTVSVQTNNPPPGGPTLAGLVRQGLKLNAGDVYGSLQVLQGEDVTLNGVAKLTGTLYVPGMPTSKLTGNSTIGSTVDGSGSMLPALYTVTLNGNASIGTLTRRTNAATMPVVTAPQAPAGTRTVTLNSATDPVGTWATVKNLTLNGNAGTVAVPAGAYGDITVNGTSSISIGTAGATTPAVYHFQTLKLNGTGGLKVLGPVIVTVGDNVTLNANAGVSTNAEWLTLKIYQGGLTLNGNVSAHAIVLAPSGKVTISGNSSLTGGLAADDLTLNGNNSVLRITKSIPTP